MTRGAIVIERAAEEVFDFVADARNVYDPRIASVEKLTPGPVGAGTQFAIESRGVGGSTVPMTVELLAHERPRRLASRTRLARMETEVELVFSPIEAGTLMRWSSSVRPLGLLRPLGPLLARTGRRQEERVWAELKRTLEGGAAPRR